MEPFPGQPWFPLQVSVASKLPMALAALIADDADGMSGKIVLSDASLVQIRVEK